MEVDSPLQMGQKFLYPLIPVLFHVFLLFSLFVDPIWPMHYYASWGMVTSMLPCCEAVIKCLHAELKIFKANPYICSKTMMSFPSWQSVEGFICLELSLLFTYLGLCYICMPETIVLGGVVFLILWFIFPVRAQWQIKIRLRENIYCI